jgi:hypothetical protein
VEVIAGRNSAAKRNCYTARCEHSGGARRCQRRTGPPQAGATGTPAAAVPQATPVDQSELRCLQPDKDYQLARAIDLLHGYSLFTAARPTDGGLLD